MELPDQKNHADFRTSEPVRTYNLTAMLLILTSAVLVVSYVETMILPAVYQIQVEFSASATTASWITSVVLLIGAACSPLFGRLGDVYGKKRMFLVAMGFYAAGVGLAGLSTSIYFLILMRALQGVGFAVLPLALAIVTDLFPKHRLGAAQGAIAGSAAISATAGLVLGSYIVQTMGWRFAFYTAFGVSLISLALASKFLVESPVHSKSKVDYAGSFMLMSGITLLLLYLTEGTELGWLSFENLLFLSLGAILTLSFFFFEKKIASPLIKLNLLRIRNILVANLISIISGFGNFLLFYAFIYYAELPKPSGLGLSELSTGLALAPATLVMLAVGPLSGKAVSRIGPKPVMLTGSSVLILGFAMFILSRSSTLDLTVNAAISMAGIVALLVPVVNMISVSSPSDSVAVGQGINSMLKSLGQAIGPVLATTVMSIYIEPSGLPSVLAFNTVFEVGIVATVIVICVSLFCKNYVMKSSE